ncbi:MAG: glycosyltransferase [Phycisphaerales bacterium]|jgi:glycosyltransferase involved in cell wall biosynthesis|nr:glycosyltransferase [Phycisphaerales bacterium]
MNIARPQSPHVVSIAEMPLGRGMAHAINTFKTTGGFRRLGLRVTLICQPPENTENPAGALIDEWLDAYGERGLGVITTTAGRGLREREASIAFAAEGVRIARDIGADLLYARNFQCGLLGPRAGIPTVMETHAHVGDPRPLLDEVFAATRAATHPLDAIVTIAPALRDHYIARGADPARVHLVPDAADPELFRRPDEFRADPRARPVALYSGHLYDYKGIPTILRAAERSPRIDWKLLGGLPEDIARVREAAAGLANVEVLGAVPHALVPRHLWNADVLLLPPSNAHISAPWTSPVKLAEYLNARRPIAASSIEGLRNWVAEPAIAWFAPDDHDSLASCVETLLRESMDARLARDASQRSLAARFTYANRARAILAAAGITLSANSHAA